MQIDFEKTLIEKTKQVNTIFVLRSGPVPADTSSLSFDANDVDAVYADSDTLAVASGRYSEFNRPTPINSTVKVDSDSSMVALQDKWHVPSVMEHDDITSLNEKGYSGFNDTYSSLITTSMNRGHHQLDFVNSTGRSRADSYVRYGLLYVSNALPAVARLARPQNIDSLTYSTLIYRGSSYGPYMVDIQYFDGASGEWVTIIERHTSFIGTKSSEFGDVTVSQRYVAINAYYYKYDITVSLDDRTILTSALRVLPTNLGSSGPGYIQNLSVYSNTKPDLPAAQLSDATHCIAYTADLYEYSIDPYIIPLTSSDFDSPSDYVSFTALKQKMDTTFGIETKESKAPPETQVTMVRNWFHSYVKSIPAIHVMFMEGPKPELPAVMNNPYMSNQSYNDVDNVFQALTNLGIEYKQLVNLGYYEAVNTSFESGLVELVDTGDKIKLRFGLDKVDPYAQNFSNGTIGYAILIPNTSTNNLVNSTAFNWLAIASVGLVGSGADIELGKLDYVDGDKFVLGDKLEIDIDFS